MAMMKISASFHPWDGRPWFTGFTPGQRLQAPTAFRLPPSDDLNKI